MVKVFERILYEQLDAYLEKHDILCQHQLGFRALRSAVTTLLEATDHKDIGKINAVILLYLKKGFDTADHKILLWYSWKFT